MTRIDLNVNRIAIIDKSSIITSKFDIIFRRKSHTFDKLLSEKIQKNLPFSNDRAIFTMLLLLLFRRLEPSLQ